MGLEFLRAILEIQGIWTGYEWNYDVIKMGYCPSSVSWNLAERWEISNLAMEVGNAGNINELTMLTWFTLWWADSFPWKTAVEDIGR